MRNVLTIKEFDTIMCNPEYQDKYAYLPERLFDDLREFVTSFSGGSTSSDALDICHIGFKRGVGETISVANYVGTIQTSSGYQVEVLPKVALSDNIDSDEATKRIFLQMLRAINNLPEKVLSDAKLKISRMSLYEIFIYMYLQEVRKIVRAGLKSAYIRQEDNLTRFKGKLLIKEHIKYNLTHKEKFYVGYDEYHIDRAENRIIKATLEKLLRESSSANNQKIIREILSYFEMVEVSVNHEAEFNKVSLDRSMTQYKDVIEWSKLFLLGRSFSTFSGEQCAKSLLFPMETVFESYVAKKLRKSLLDTGWKVSTQDRGKYLFDTPRKFALRPDIVIYRDDGTKIILDTKWKRLYDNPRLNYGISQADMYQMFAYAHRYDAKDVWLIYPLTEEMRGHDDIIYENADPVKVRLFFVDLEHMIESMAKLRDYFLCDV